MKQLQLSYTDRPEKGRHPASRLRKVGRIPSVIYGRSGSFPISVEDAAFRLLLREKGDVAATVQLKNGDKSVLTIINEIQRNTIDDHFMHVDFQEIREDEKFHIVVPLRVKGEAYGVKNEKAMLEVVRREITIRCLPKDLIESIEVDVTDLHAGQNIHIKNLPQFEGVEYPGDPNGVVIACIGEEQEESSAGEEAATAANA